MSIPIEPVPDVVLASEFPSLADRPAGTYNAKAKAWADSENAMAQRVREIAVSAHNNAQAAEQFATRAADAESAATQAEDARDAAQGYAEDAEDYKNSAANFAAAAGAAAGVPAMEGKEGMALVVEPGPNPGDPPVAAWGDPVRIGSVIQAAFPPDDRYIETGKTYLQSAYPRLFDVVGIKPSTPAGELWEPVYSGPSSAFTGGAVGGSGTIVAIRPNGSLRSTDGGESWVGISGLNAGAVGVVAVGDTTFIAYGSGVDFNGPFRSTNDGQSFALSGHMGSNVGCTKPAVLSATDVLTTSSNVVRRSIDAGATWTSLGTAPAISIVMSSPVLVLPNGNALFFGNAGVAETSDAGESFSIIPDAPRGAVEAILVDGVIFVLCALSAVPVYTRLYRSFDYGATWQELNFVTPYQGRSITSVGGRLIVATSQATYFSDDFGVTWHTTGRGEGSGYPSIQHLLVRGSDVFGFGGMASSGAILRSVPELAYDADTMFHVPFASAPLGYKSLIKAS